MRIKIVSESTCDLPDELLRKYDITILPLHINKNGEVYLDGVEIKPSDIFSYVASGGEICSTAAVNVGEYMDCFDVYSPLYDAVIVITIGSGFSSCFQNAQVAAQEYQNVYVVDSASLSCGQGLLVLKAAELARKDIPPEEICQQLYEAAAHIEASFVLDRLDYIKKGGRCSAVAALGANLLKIKPCIEVKNGQMTVGKKYRGSFAKVIGQYTKERLDSCRDVCTDFVFVAQSDAEQSAIDAAKHALAEDGRFEAVVDACAGCTVACHCGPSTLGVFFFRK